MDTLVLIVIVQIINFIITLTISKIEILINDYIIQYSILLLVDIICEIPLNLIHHKYIFHMHHLLLYLSFCLIYIYKYISML